MIEKKESVAEKGGLPARPGSAPPAGRELKVLMYHVVSNESLPYLKHLYAYKSSERFERDIIYLKQNYNLVSYEDFIKDRFRGDIVKPDSVMLTFDDGYRELFSEIRPLLLKHGIAGTFFVSTGFIDNRHMYYRNKISLCIEEILKSGRKKRLDRLKAINRAFGRNLKRSKSFARWIKSFQSFKEDRIDEICSILEIDIRQYLKERRPYLKSDEVKQLVSDGFTVGAHGRLHHKLGTLGEDEIEEEVVGSCREIMNLTGREHLPFAFPFTGWDIAPQFLETLISKYQFIKLIFGVRGDNKRFIKDRIWVDCPRLRLEDAGLLGGL